MVDLVGRECNDGIVTFMSRQAALPELRAHPRE